MSSRKTPLFVRTLLEMFEANSSKFGRRNPRGGNIRLCGTLAVRRASLPLCPPTPIRAPCRSFINLASPTSNPRMEYTEQRTLRYTPEQIYSVVASVDQYQHFVPWCKKSQMKKGRSGRVRAELVIGFPPVSESYVSDVTVIPYQEVRALCTDGSLFSHLETIWRFAPGPEDQPDSCTVDFYVSFEFKSFLHSRLAGLFFDEVVKQTVSAFESRAATLYKSQQGVSLKTQST